MTIVVLLPKDVQIILSLHEILEKHDKQAF